MNKIENWEKIPKKTTKLNCRSKISVVRHANKE